MKALRALVFLVLLAASSQAQETGGELAKVKDRLTELQKAKKATLQMYAAACNRLGVPNDLADADQEAPSIG